MEDTCIREQTDQSEDKPRSTFDHVRDSADRPPDHTFIPVPEHRFNRLSNGGNGHRPAPSGRPPVDAIRTAERKLSGTTILAARKTQDHRIYHRLLLWSSAQIGGVTLSLAALAAVLLSSGGLAGWIWQPLAALAVIRIGFLRSFGPKPVLAKLSIRKRLFRVFEDEGWISLIFLATCFAFAWPISRSSAAVFVITNIALQSTTFFAARALHKRYAGRSGRDKTCCTKRAYILGTGDLARHVADAVLDAPDLQTSIAGFFDFRRNGIWSYRDIPLIGNPENIERMVATNQVDAVFVAVEPRELPLCAPLFRRLERMGVTVCFVPGVFKPALFRTRPTFINGVPMIVYRAVPDHQPSLMVKSIIDRLGALAGIIISLPFMLTTAIAIKLDSRGPILFSQIRVGLNGKLFRLHKFRTMCCDAEKKKADLMTANEMSGPVFKMRQDPRITRVGRLLRKYSVDELPQFFNVLVGEMSLVGPRPPLPNEVAGFEPWQHRKLSVKPGITCLWQINGRNNIDFDHWMELDLKYIDTWSLAEDARILVRTVPTVLKGSGV